LRGGGGCPRILAFELRLDGVVIPLKVVTNLAEVDLCFSQICHFRTFNDNGVYRRIVEVIYLLLALHQHNFSFILGNVACKRG